MALTLGASGILVDDPPSLVKPAGYELTDLSVFIRPEFLTGLNGRLNGFKQKNQTTFYEHHSCSFTTCYEACIPVKWDEHFDSPMGMLTADTMVLDIAVDCLPSRIRPQYRTLLQNQYSTAKNINCASQCALASQSDASVTEIADCAACAVPTVISEISNIASSNPATQPAACALTMWGALGELLKPHLECVSECASPVHTWSENWGHECRDDVSPDKISCDEFGFDIIQKFTCVDCSYSYDSIVENCYRQDKVCVQTQSGAACRGTGDDPDNDDDSPPDPPGRDQPDDRYDVSSLRMALVAPATNGSPPDIAVLKKGFPEQIRGMLADMNLSSTYMTTGAVSTLDPEVYPVLIIPSGGLYGLDSAPSFRTYLERYAAAGGTVIAFSQQHGYEYRALPGGGVSGYGWLEDQQCQIRSAALTAYLPPFSSFDEEILDFNIDGYLTSVPDNSSILLTRTKNGMPAMILYPYGNGSVIASTLFSDMAAGQHQGTGDEKKLIQGLLNWAKDRSEMPNYPLGPVNISINISNANFEALEYPVPEFNPGDVVALSVDVFNGRNVSADSVSFVIFNPSYQPEDWLNVSENIPANQSANVNLTYLTRSDAPKGIWSMLYLLSKDGNYTYAGYAGEFAMNYSIADHSNFTAIVTIKDPSGAPVAEKRENMTVLPGRTVPVNISFDAFEKGIWTARYTVLDSSGKKHASGAEPFTVGTIEPYNGSLSFGASDVSFVITSPDEHYPEGAQAPFTFHLWNHGTADENVTVTWGLIHHFRKGVVPKGVKPWDHSFEKTVFVPAGGNASFVYILPGVAEFDRLRANLYDEQGQLLGSADRGIYMDRGELLVNVTMLSGVYRSGSVVPLSIELEQPNFNTLEAQRYYVGNNWYLPNYDLRIQVMSPDNSLAYDEVYSSVPRGAFTEYNCLYFPQGECPHPDYHLTYNLALPDKGPGVYTVIISADKWYGSQPSLPLLKKAKVGFGATSLDVPDNSVRRSFDRSSYHQGDNLTMNLLVPNNRNTTWNQTFNVSIPMLGFNQSWQISLEPWEGQPLNFTIPLPSNLQPGSHNVFLTLVDENITETTTFTVPPSRLKYVLEDTRLDAGGNITVRLQNTGGTGTNYTYHAFLKGPSGEPIFNQTSSGSLKAGEADVLNHSINPKAASGYYLFTVRYVNNETGESDGFTKFLHITGYRADVEAAAGKEVYASWENITLQANITSLDMDIEGATLALRIVATEPKASCTVPYNDMIITSDVTLCPGSYTIPDTGLSGVLIIGADNVEVEGSGVVITGTGSGRGLYNPGYSNVTVSNVNLNGYPAAAYLYYNYPSLMGSNNALINSTLGGSVTIYGQKGSEITGSTITKGVSLYSADWAIIRDNVIDDEVYSEESNNVTVVGNLITPPGIWDSGIELLDEDWNDQSGWRIEDNTIDMPSGSYSSGILLDTSNFDINDIIIRNNTVTGGRRGIYIYDDGGWLYNISIIGNTLINQTYDGVTNDGGEKITITNNTISGCGEKGIFLDTALTSTLSNNQITGTTCGFDVDGGGLPEFIHYIDTSNTVNGRPTIYLLGESDRVIDSSLDPYFVGVVSGRNITVRDLVVKGLEHGVLFANITDSTIRNVTSLDSYYGLYLLLSDNNTLRDNYVNHSGYRGIVLIGSEANMLEANNVSWGNTGVEVQGIWNGSSYTLCSNNILLGNRIEHNTYRGFNSYNYCQNTLLNSNLIAHNTREGVYISFLSANTTLLGNNISYNMHGISMNGGNNTAMSNWISRNTYNGLEIIGSGNIILNNTVDHNGKTGIILRQADNNTVANNSASYNGWVGGIVLRGSNRNLISNNTANENNNIGIKIDRYTWYSYSYNSYNNTLIDNTANNNTLDGIYIYAYTYNNTLTDNKALGNQNNGLSIYSPSSSTLTGNYFCSNTNLDIYNTSGGYVGTIGDLNTCNTTNGWNDNGTTDCTYTCPGPGGGGTLSTHITALGSGGAGWTQPAGKLKLGSETLEKGVETLKLIGAGLKLPANSMQLDLRVFVKKALHSVMSQLSGIIPQVWAQPTNGSHVTRPLSIKALSGGSSDVVWSLNTTIDAKPTAAVTYDTGTLNATGKLYLQATLYSPTGQIIGYSITPFYIASSELALTMETDKLAYKPGETIQITGEVQNKGPARNTTLLLKADGTTIHTLPLSLGANETRPYSYNYTAASSFKLEAMVEGEKAVDHITVEQPQITGTLTAPDTVGWREFKAGLTLDNTGNVSADLHVIMANQTWDLTLPAGKESYLETNLTVRTNTTLNATVSGDAALYLSRNITYGDGADINLTLQPLYAAGKVTVPYTIRRTGVLNTSFNATFQIGSDLETQGHYLLSDEPVNGSITFNLTRGLHTLRYTSPFWNGTTELNVEGPPRFRITGMPGNQTLAPGEIMNLNVTVRNTGGRMGQAKGLLSSPGLFNESNWTWIPAGEEQNLSFAVFVPDDVPEGWYMLTAKVRGEENHTRVYIPGANISVEAGLDRLFYSEGDIATLTMRVVNQNSRNLSLMARVQFNDHLNITPFTLQGGGNRTLTFKMPLSFTGDDKMLYSVYTASGRSLYINSLYVHEAPPSGAGITVYTDKGVYGLGDNATIYVNATTGGLLNLTAPGYSFSQNLSAHENLTLGFTIPALLRGTYYVEYTYNGYSLSYPFDVDGYFARMLETGLDKDLYRPGEPFTLSSTIESNHAFESLVNISLYDSDDSRIAAYTLNMNLTPGENTLRYTGAIPLDVDGLTAVVPRVIIDLAGHSPVILVSGTEYFDVLDYNTKPGSNVRVQFPGQGVNLTFSNVTSEGDTNVTPLESGPQAPPSSFNLSGTIYDIHTTSTYNSTVEVCIAYNESLYEDESSLRLLHFENGTWVDVTTTVDIDANIVCGEVTGFSVFAVAGFIKPADSNPASGGGGGGGGSPGLPAGEKVLVVANSIDGPLATDFLSYLAENNIEATVLNATGFTEDVKQNNRLIIILGGPDAPEGVGEITREVLSDAEEAAVRTAGAQAMYAKYDVWTNRYSAKQTVVIVAGSDRASTKASEDLNNENVKTKMLQ